MRFFPFQSALKKDDSLDEKGFCAAIGVFDGIHKGHQTVIKQVLEDADKMGAMPVVITFDRHPASILAPDKTPKIIYPLEHKLRLFEQYGIENIMLIPFDLKTANLEAIDFYNIINSVLHPLRSICVGEGFVFARNRSGNVEKLKELAESSHRAEELKTLIRAIPPVRYADERISSTRIRTEILQGNLRSASEMLGRAYSIVSKVIKGDQLGRTIGFPTANLDIQGRAIPPCGVYSVSVLIDGQKFAGALNIGFRPTVAKVEPELRAEVHISNFSEDIYEKTIEVIPLEKIRDEKNFSSLDILKKQLQEDTAKCESIFLRLNSQLEN